MTTLFNCGLTCNGLAKSLGRVILPYGLRRNPPALLIAPDSPFAHSSSAQAKRWRPARSE